jgi:hypothetical protein
VPTPKQVDALILEHAAAQAALLTGGSVKRLPGETAAALDVRLKIWQTDAAEYQAGAAAKAGEVKTRLLAMVAEHGLRHAEKSMRLTGEHNRATVTTGTRVETVAAGVDAFKAGLERSKVPGIADLFFTPHVSYSLVAGPADVLKTLTLGTRLRTKLTALVALCFEIRTNAPSLKIDAVAAGKPAQG